MNTDKEKIEKIRELGHSIMEVMPAIMEEVNHLLSIPYRTPDEDNHLVELYQLIKEASPILEMLAAFFGERAYKATVAMYYNVREQAEKGNKEAEKIYLDLKPKFEAALREQLGDEGLN